MKRLYPSLICTFFGAFFVLGAQAEEWPTKPIRLIVPFTAGGTTDTVARLISERLTPRLGQSIVVDNRGGAGGTLGSEVAAKSAPDGYTFIVGTASTMAIAPQVYAKPRYDPIRDFASVTLLGMADILVVVNRDLPIRRIQELLAYAKTHPGKLTFASAGNGSISHLLGEYFNYMAKVKLEHIPYKGDAQIVPDMIAGRVSMSFGTAVGYMPHVNSGKLVAIAVTNPTRSTSLPDLPTVSESGVPGYAAVQWFGLSAPAGTPRAIVQRMYTETKQVLATPDVIKRFKDLGFEVAGTSPEEYDDFVRAENAKWKKVVEVSGTRLH